MPNMLHKFGLEFNPFEPIRRRTSPQRSGNSAQQMGKYGRVASRESIVMFQK